jgi:hypothetical protein
MDRYTTPLTLDITKKIPYYKTTLVSKIPMENIPFHYVSRNGDRWDSLSYRFYGTSQRWWILAKANNMLDGSIAVPEGTTLFIPNI